jgi:EF hand
VPGCGHGCLNPVYQIRRYKNRQLHLELLRAYIHFWQSGRFKLKVLTTEIPMFSTRVKMTIFVISAGLFAIGATVRTAVAHGQAATSAPQTATTAAPEPAPDAPKVAAGTDEAMKLLRLMDADQSGKISRAEYMAFMAAEFDRLDINHDGELDLKELEKSQLITARHGGGHR